MALVGGIFCTARIFKYRVNIIEILNTLRKEMDKMTNSIAIYYVNISAEACLKSSGAGGIRQTAKAPVDLRIRGGFPIYGDGGVDGFLLYSHESGNLFAWQDHA